MVVYHPTDRPLPEPSHTSLELVDSSKPRTMQSKAQMNRYNIDIDGKMFDLNADSLAAVVNQIRQIIRDNGKAKRVKVWSQAGIMLIDTEFGDTYGILS